MKKASVNPSPLSNSAEDTPRKGCNAARSGSKPAISKEKEFTQ